MRRLILAASLIAILSGCSFLEARKSDLLACKSDPVCYEQAKSWQGKTESVATVVSAMVPAPGAAAAPKVIGYASFLLAMLLGGHAINKKKTKDSV
jgi:hypothetical protein